MRSGSRGLRRRSSTRTRTCALRDGLVAPAGARKLVVTDGVFSMEGDLAKLPEIVELADEHDAVVVVDDSHGVGVLGETARDDRALRPPRQGST